MTKLAIFDCDGTLVDSGATIHRGARARRFDVHGLNVRRRRRMPPRHRAQPDRSDGGIAARRR